MAAQLLDGKKIAAQIRAEIREEVAQFVGRHDVVPCLAAVLVGDDPASGVYVRNKQRDCRQVGIESRLEHLPADTSAPQLCSVVASMNGDPSVHGILVQLPLPAQIAPASVLDVLDPRKDVDAFHPENMGRIAEGRPRFLPCTPHGIQQLLHRCDIPVAGRHVVIVGRSQIVGKPLALMLLARDSTCGPQVANATVTVCHSRTPQLAMMTRQADILVAAVGRAGLITAEMVRPGATVVDVGINRTDAGLVGDVDFEAVRQVAGYLTPVPGGVGPLTRAMLLYNTLTAARAQVAEKIR